MSKTAHTPGPWRVVIDDDGNPLSGRPMVAAAPELDCAIVHWDGFVQPYWRSARGDKEIHANARLIAGAPDLLEALEKLAGEMFNIACHAEDIHCHAVEMRISEIYRLVAPALAAIARAKGEA